MYIINTLISDMKEKETYKIQKAKCSNCGKEFENMLGNGLDIPKETKIEKFPCPNCGCNSLFRWDV